MFYHGDLLFESLSRAINQDQDTIERSEKICQVAHGITFLCQTTLI